jgi:hypothetical protein
MAQAQNVNILHAKQSDASIQFYDANHLYLMKIARIKRDQQKSNTTSTHNPSIAKKTYQAKPQS